MIGYYRYTEILSYLSVASAVLGIYLALTSSPKYAVICLIASGLCDMFDGTVARRKQDRTEEERGYGIQIDSLCDAISFGVLPVAIGFSLGLNQLVHAILMSAYVLAALIRLAYFNVTELKMQQEGTLRDHYLGLPVTSVAGIIPFVYLACVSLGLGPLTAVYGGMMAILAIAFVLRFRLPKIGFRYMVAMAILAIPVTYLIAVS